MICRHSVSGVQMLQGVSLVTISKAYLELSGTGLPQPNTLATCAVLGVVPTVHGNCSTPLVAQALHHLAHCACNVQCLGKNVYPM